MRHLQCGLAVVKVFQHGECGVGPFTAVLAEIYRGPAYFAKAELVVEKASPTVKVCVEVNEAVLLFHLGERPLDELCCSALPLEGGECAQIT